MKLDYNKVLYKTKNAGISIEIKDKNYLRRMQKGNICLGHLLNITKGTSFKVRDICIKSGDRYKLTLKEYFDNTKLNLKHLQTEKKIPSDTLNRYRRYGLPNNVEILLCFCNLTNTEVEDFKQEN